MGLTVTAEVNRSTPGKRRLHLFFVQVIYITLGVSGLKGRSLRLLSAYTIFALAIESGDGNPYHGPHGKMHSTITGPSHSKRCGGLPCMRWSLQTLRRL